MTTVDDLRARIDAAQNHQLEIAAERDEIAYEALVDRKPAAIKKLDALNAELSRVSTEIASLNVAFAESGRRSAVAEASRRDAEERDNASEALKLLDTFAKRGAALDEAFDKMISEYVALESSISPRMRARHSRAQSRGGVQTFGHARSRGLIATRPPRRHKGDRQHGYSTFRENTDDAGQRLRHDQARL